MEKVQSYDVVVVGGGAAGIAAAVGAAQAGAACLLVERRSLGGQAPMPTWPPTAVSLPTAILPNKL